MNFGYTKRDYEELTQKEKAFIIKAWENKAISDGVRMYQACFSAFYNANRGKNKPAVKPFQKKKVRKADMEIVSHNLDIINEVEENEGKSWIDAIYAASGMRRPQKEVE